MPEPASEPQPIVSGTEALVYHGPPASAADSPLGAVVSFDTVKLAAAVWPAPFVTVTVCRPDAVVFWSHVYEPWYGEVVSSPPPVIPETDGKPIFWTPDWPSVAVASTVKLALFEPCAL